MIVMEIAIIIIIIIISIKRWRDGCINTNEIHTGTLRMR